MQWLADKLDGPSATTIATPAPAATEPAPQSGAVTITDTEITVHLKSTESARQAIGTLRLHKKELALQKRELVRRQRMERATYTAKNRSRGPSPRGRGWINELARNSYTATKARDLEQLNRAMLELQNAQNEVERRIALTDKAIVRVEDYMQRVRAAEAAPQADAVKQGAVTAKARRALPSRRSR